MTNLDYLSPYEVPNIKADAGQDVAMCGAFASKGIDVRLLRRRLAATGDLFEHYGAARTFDVVDLLNSEPPRQIRGIDDLPLVGSRRRAQAAVRLARQTRPNATVYTRDPVAAWAAARLDRRVIWEAMNYPDRRAERFVASLLRSPRLIGAFAITGALARDIHAAFGGVALRRLPVGVDVERFSGVVDTETFRREHGLALDRPLLVYTGFMRAERGVDVLLEAATRYPEAEFVLVGGREGEVNALRDASAAVGASNVRLPGLRPPTEMPDWQRAADVLLLPQRASNRHLTFHVSPAKLFEYFAAGRPVVASDLPCIREVIATEADGVLVAADDPGAWAAACRALVDDQARRASLGRRGIELAQAHSWRVRVDHILSGLRDDD